MGLALSSRDAAKINSLKIRLILDRIRKTIDWYDKTEHTLQWRRNGRDGVSDHLLQDCLLNRLFRRRKHQSSASLAFVQEIHRSPFNSPYRGPVTRKMFPFDEVIMNYTITSLLMGSTLGHLRYVEWNGAGSGANQRLGGHVNTSQTDSVVTGIEYIVWSSPDIPLMLNPDVKNTSCHQTQWQYFCN